MNPNAYKGITAPAKFDLEGQRYSKTQLQRQHQHRLQGASAYRVRI